MDEEEKFDNSEKYAEKKFANFCFTGSAKYLFFFFGKCFKKNY